MQHHRSSTGTPYRVGIAAIALLGGAFAAHPAAAQDTPAPAAATPPAVTPTQTTPQATVPGTPPATNPPAAAPPATNPPAPKQTPVPADSNFTISGLLDFYYQYQFSNPKHSANLTGRIYDFRHSTPTFALAWIDIGRAPKPNGFGFHVSLASGDDADADVPAAQSGTGESRFKNLAEIYGTYMGPSGFTVDVGKFLSPYGFDTTKSTLNFNYSLTLATFLVPNYLGGLRATYPFKNPNLAASIYVVNSLEETPTSGFQEDNGTKDFLFRLNYTSPGGKINYIPAVGIGKDKLGSAGNGNEKITLWDNWLIVHLTPATTLAGEYVYRKDKDDGGGYDLRGDGVGVYVHQQLSKKTAATLRWSHLTKHMDSFAFDEDTVSSSFAANEVTATYELKLYKNLTTRFEFRHDWTNNAAAFGFVNGDKSTPASSQNTLTAATLITF